MEKIDILLWIVGVGFTFNFSLMLVIWGSVNSRFERLESRIDKLDEKVTDIDRRICRLEGAFASKDCCMIKDERQLHKAE